MPAGRPRKPTALHKLEGTYRPDREPKHQPTPDARVPDCPADLAGIARETWMHYAPLLGSAGLLTLADEAGFRLFCEAAALYDEACRVLADEGLTYTTPTGQVKPRPEVGIRDVAVRDMKSLMTEFGMTPSSRSRIHVEPPAATEPSEWDEISDGRRFLRLLGDKGGAQTS